MEREIKFRAWDIDHSQFLPTDSYAIISTDFNAFGIMIKDWDNYREGEYLYPNSQILTQYTGLKDKNGKEIFEGDLVQHDAWNYPFEVIFYQEKARFVCKMKTGLTQIIIGESLEVIGNIYENPEILNK